MPQDFGGYLDSFQALPQLRERIQQVLESLPDNVQQDFLDDTTFQIRPEEFTPEKGWTMFMNLPVSVSAVSRCVVLRAKLEQAPLDFASYVIAHELAHAFLRNGGWDDITDPEDAADALAASWGFPRPKQRWF